MALDPSLYINRELSWLEFNSRVLHEAFDPRNALLERLKFLSIFSTNLDEFYMVRVAGLRRQIAAGVQHVPPDGMTPADQLAAILKRVAELVEQQQQCLYDVLLPELEEHGIRLVWMEELTPEEMQRVDQFFESQVFPVLTPLAVDPGHPFPYISNLSLSLAVQIYDPATDTTRFARVKVPRSLPRWIPFGRPNQFVPLERLQHVPCNPVLRSGARPLRRRRRSARDHRGASLPAPLCRGRPRRGSERHPARAA
jgi:polyphosphate kinase